MQYVRLFDDFWEGHETKRIAREAGFRCLNDLVRKMFFEQHR